ncbi:UNVERIFIED_CONTAM: hypothetical protein FKN15_038497 [Acipenser sinensis]
MAAPMSWRRLLSCLKRPAVSGVLTRISDRLFRRKERSRGSSVFLLAPLLGEVRPLPALAQPRPPACSATSEGLLQRFHWVADQVPAFWVSGGQVHVLHSPDEFYRIMKANIKTAKRRVVMASLYLGTGPLEQELVRAGKKNSRSMLLPLLQRFPGQMHVSLYHTPDLRGVLKTLIPERFNETIGLQHMKVYVFDDSLIISGANLSDSYFTNRQDRYILLQDCAELADFFSELVGAVGDVSLQLQRDDTVQVKEGMVHPYKGDDSRVFLTSGYFNLTCAYMELVLGTRADYRILLASPEVNGFFGAKGVAGAIPAAYIHIARQFYSKVCRRGQQDRIRLYEYIRRDWTFHAKGLWYYFQGSERPCLTLIGSPNFGYRSVHRDLEAQLAIVTENQGLQAELQQRRVRID